LVASGAKRQTIRPTPKRWAPKAGDKESWRKWSGRAYRSPQIELAQVELASVEPISIHGTGLIVVSGKDLSWKDCETLADKDGFDSLEAFTNWFMAEQGLPFRGILIKAK
jgi:hypothetical protein